MKSKASYELKYPNDTLSVHTGSSDAILALQKFLNERGYTDGYVEAELERIEEQGGVENPAQKQTEEWTKAKGKALEKQENYMGAYTMGYYD